VPTVVIDIKGDLGAAALGDEPHTRSDDALGDQSCAWGEGCGDGARDRVRGPSEAERALGRDGACGCRGASVVMRRHL